MGQRTMPSGLEDPQRALRPAMGRLASASLKSGRVVDFRLRLRLKALMYGSARVLGRRGDVDSLRRVGDQYAFVRADDDASAQHRDVVRIFRD